MIKNQIKIIEIVKEWMHGCVIENTRKIKIKMENIWVDLIRSIYAPYSVKDHDTTNNSPSEGGGLEAGAQESHSTSDIELEDDVLPPDKGEGKAVPDDTAQGGSGHDLPRHQKTTYCLQR